MYKIKVCSSWVTEFLNEKTQPFPTLESAIQRAKLESECLNLSARIYRFDEFTCKLVWTYHNPKNYMGEP